MLVVGKIRIKLLCGITSHLPEWLTLRPGTARVGKDAEQLERLRGADGVQTGTFT